jgi:hypothetical protein
LKEREEFATDVVKELSWPNMKTDFTVANVV